MEDDGQDDGPRHTIFVGDLASDVTEVILQEIFKTHYPSVKGAKIVTEKMTGRCKGYGFVRFGDENEQMRAVTEMNCMYCSSRPIRIGPATNKKSVTDQQFQSGLPEALILEGLQLISAEMIHHCNPWLILDSFSYGELLDEDYWLLKGLKACAEQALLILNGTQLGGQSVRLSSGCSLPNKQTQTEQSQWNGGYYGYPQGYEAYGYAPPAQDPSMDYGGYAGYNYQQPTTYQQPQQ